MAAHVRCTALVGVDAVRVDVEAHVYGAQKRITIVGLPDSALRESRERVRCAINNSGLGFPNHDVIVSLAPAALPKAGSGFDLAIALSILAADGKLDVNFLRSCVALGELALDGRVKATPGALAAACHVQQESNLSLLIPATNYATASYVSGVNLVSVRTLREAVNYINSRGERSQSVDSESAEAESAECIAVNSDSERLSDPSTESLSRPALSRPAFQLRTGPDFDDVIGQNIAKRAFEIAAAGGHNLLLIGPPGAGKSMLASRISSILPELTPQEIIEITKVHSAGNSHGDPQFDRLIANRPFRAPHHTASTAGIIGGGAIPQPGEISLAHKGVLFLDEFPEFRRETLEALRQPLETRSVVISRSATRIRFPADFLLVAAMNPCPCGKRGSANLNCECTPMIRKRYLSKLSGPLLDRIDLQLWIQPLKSTELTAGASMRVESLASASCSLLRDRVRTDESRAPITFAMRDRVRESRARQSDRFSSSARCNASMSSKEIRQFCELTSEGQTLLERAVERLNLSARGYHRVLKVSRTIADLEHAQSIAPEHLAEALSYRLNQDALTD